MSRACPRAGAKIGAVRETGRPLFCVDQSGTLAEMKKALLLIALLLTACGEDGPPAPTEAENHQLDEAEAMLNAAGNETGPTNRPR